MRAHEATHISVIPRYVQYATQYLSLIVSVMTIRDNSRLHSSVSSVYAPDCFGHSTALSACVRSTPAPQMKMLQIERSRLWILHLFGLDFV